MKTRMIGMDGDGQRLIGLDLGTSMLKGVLTDVRGSILRREREPAAYLRFGKGCVEFDADTYYARIAALLRRLTASLPDAARVAAVSVASASGNTLLTDEAGRPTISAISWLDGRAAGEIDTVLPGLSPQAVYETVGWPRIDAFPLAHLAWLRVHEPEKLDGAARVCMSTDYVYFRLTGRWGIDPSTATTFYLQHQNTARWHAPYLEALGIPLEKLSPIGASGAVLGAITPRASEETGLACGVPVVLGAFDHPCAARGAGVLGEGAMMLSCGTSWVAFLPVADRTKIIRSGMLCDPFLHPGGPWAGMASLSAVSDRIEKILRASVSDGPDRYAQLDRLAALAPPGAGGLSLDPMGDTSPSRLESYSKAEIARALMEGTAGRLKKEMSRFEAEGIRPSEAVMVGGLSESAVWPQIISDVLEIDVLTGGGSWAGAAGAAKLAGTGVGLYADGEGQFDAGAVSLNRWMPRG